MVEKRRLAICVLLTAGPLMAADAAPPVSDEAVDAIVQQIDAGRYPEALAAAKKAMSAYKPQPTGKGMDKAYVRLLDCVAAASLGQKQFKPAQLAAAQAFNSGFKGRSVTLHLAQAEIQLKTEVAHAAAIMRDFCDAHPDDVEAFGLFGAAVQQAVLNGKSQRVTDPLTKRYEAQLPKIEASKPGSKRWGANWVTSAEYARLDSERDWARGRVADQERVVDKAEAIAVQRQKELKQADWNNGQLHGGNKQALGPFNARIKQAQAVKDREQKKLDALKAAVPLEDFSAALVLTPPEPDVKGSK